MKKLLKKPAFLIQMLDNQNMTWQGTITYLENNQKVPFRSVLELIKLMDSAMDDAAVDEDGDADQQEE
ncbi:MAG: hypothetical protein LBH09_04575 [Peptococcaceae bacterium]|jgi:hypothetical protein|nr:hypothetical protein [Peptococcaceae bacterium]